MQNRSLGFTLWFTGLPCSGKSTLAELVGKELERNGREVEILDGDRVRTNLTKGLGFSKTDRDENVRRIGFVCGLLSSHGVVAISAAISPYRAVREEIRSKISNFVEVYVDAPLEVCIGRDVKGMYRKALAGELQNFTGISDPYEAPISPDLVIKTQDEVPEESTSRVISKLKARGLLERAEEPGLNRETARSFPIGLARAVGD